MIRRRFSFVEGFSPLFQDIVELRPEFQSAALGFIHAFVLRNAFYRFGEVVWLFNDFELRGWFRISDSVSVDLKQEGSGTPPG